MDEIPVVFRPLATTALALLDAVGNFVVSLAKHERDIYLKLEAEEGFQSDLQARLKRVEQHLGFLTRREAVKHGQI